MLSSVLILKVFRTFDVLYTYRRTTHTYTNSNTSILHGLFIHLTDKSKCSQIYMSVKINLLNKLRPPENITKHKIV